MITQACILAGGAGTRLAAVAGQVPKVLVPVGGKPVLQHQLELVAAHGVKTVRIFAGHLAEQIVDWVGGLPASGLEIELRVETEALGNAGALLAALNDLEDQFFVLYGDVMVAMDLGKLGGVHLARDADFTAVVHPNDHPFDSDLVEMDADSRIRELHPYPHPEHAVLPNLVSAALYAVRRDCLLPFQGDPGKRDFTKHVIPDLLRRNARVFGYRTAEYLKDMGTPQRLDKVRADWESGRIGLAGAGALQAAVFLDRDGTLNEWRGYVRTPGELDLIEGAAEALRLLRQAGYRLVMLTNQPVIARGEVSEAELERIHRKLEWALGQQGAFLDAAYVCPHHPDSGFPGERRDLKIVCDCRKPGTAMLIQAASDLHLDVARSWVIGDSTRDVELARRAGARSILVETGEGGRDGRFPGATPDYRARNLLEAARWLIGRCVPGPLQGALEIASTESKSAGSAGTSPRVPV